MDSEEKLREILTQIRNLRQSIGSLSNASSVDSSASDSGVNSKIVRESGSLIDELQALREAVSPYQFGSIGISLGRPDKIAKFFAYSFLNQARNPLAELSNSPFLGSGVYAVYYIGTREIVYRPLSRTETPIYLGKADPANPLAETVEEQGKTLFKRLREHARNISKTELDLKDFEYRAAPIQTGFQSAVEEFLIRLFRPVWNREVGICFGIGKHGDSAKTRANKRSPWDTMHPGRKWAKEIKDDQMERSAIEEKIRIHFQNHPVFPTREYLFKALLLR